MKNCSILFFLLIANTFLLAQSQIGIRAGMYGFNEDLIYPKGNSLVEGHRLLPAFGVEASFGSSFGKSYWYWGAGFSYRLYSATGTAMVLVEVPVAGNTGGYSGGNSTVPVYKEAIKRDNISTGGFALGLTYRFSKQKGIDGLKLGFGSRVSAMLTSNSTFKIEGEEEFDDSWSRFDTKEIDKGLIYGAYIRPSYSLKIGGQDSRLMLVMYGEWDVLWRNQAADQNPLFVAGGGLGVSFALEGRRKGNGVI